MIEGELFYIHPEWSLKDMGGVSIGADGKYYFQAGAICLPGKSSRVDRRSRSVETGNGNTIRSYCGFFFSHPTSTNVICPEGICFIILLLRVFVHTNSTDYFPPKPRVLANAR